MNTSDYRMATTGSLLRRGLQRRGDALILTLDPAFQGLPETAHGGAVLAAFHLLAGEPASGVLRGVYRKRVPLGVPLPLLTARRDDALTCQLRDAADAILVDGGVTGPETHRPGLAAEGAPLRADHARPLPVSSTCFACGVDNPRGLRVRLAHDEASVGGTWQPRDPFRDDDGGLAPLALTTLLDEAAFWLGALASGESGMTTELAVTLHADVPFGRSITVAGPRAGVHSRADDPRYWDTTVAAWDEAGQLVAEARITFVAVRGAARRLAAWLARVNPPEVVRGVFPLYAPTGVGWRGEPTAEEEERSCRRRPSSS